MPILPIIDLLILSGWSVLTVGGLLKIVYVTTRYRPEFLGLGPFECLMVAGILLLLSLALSARTWVKAQEGAGVTLTSARARSTLDAFEAAQARADEAARADAAEGDRVAAS